MSEFFTQVDSHTHVHLEYSEKIESHSAHSHTTGSVHLNLRKNSDPSFDHKSKLTVDVV